MPIKIDDNLENEIVRLYLDGFGVMELSDKYNLHRCTIQRVLLRNNIQLRKRTPFHYDIHFFDNYNVNSCYWAGFIAADGYIRSDRDTVTIHLANGDASHLEKLKELTRYQGDVKIYDKDCYLSFNGKWFINALENNFDIYPRKTYNIKMSNKIPEDMIPHFLRGYFDGDGSAIKCDDYLRINFTSGSDVLLNQISDYIYNFGIKVRNETGKAKKFNYYIGFNCSKAMRILNMLYFNSTNLTRLDRKYQIYLDYKKKSDTEIPIFTQDRDYIENILKTVRND